MADFSTVARQGLNFMVQSTGGNFPLGRINRVYGTMDVKRRGQIRLDKETQRLVRLVRFKYEQFSRISLAPSGGSKRSSLVDTTISERDISGSKSSMKGGTGVGSTIRPGVVKWLKTGGDIVEGLGSGRWWNFGDVFFDLEDEIMIQFIEAEDTQWGSELTFEAVLQHLPPIYMAEYEAETRLEGPLNEMEVLARASS